MIPACADPHLFPPREPKRGPARARKKESTQKCECSLFDSSVSRLILHRIVYLRSSQEHHAMSIQLGPQPPIRERHLPFECVALALQDGGALGAYRGAVRWSVPGSTKLASNSPGKLADRRNPRLRTARFEEQMGRRFSIAGAASPQAPAGASASGKFGTHPQTNFSSRTSLVVATDVGVGMGTSLEAWSRP